MATQSWRTHRESVPIWQSFCARRCSRPLAPAAPRALRRVRVLLSWNPSGTQALFCPATVLFDVLRAVRPQYRMLRHYSANATGRCYVLGYSPVVLCRRDASTCPLTNLTGHDWGPWPCCCNRDCRALCGRWVKRRCGGAAELPCACAPTVFRVSQDGVICGIIQVSSNAKVFKIFHPAFTLSTLSICRRYADRRDKVCIILGVLAAAIGGTLMPVFTIFLGEMVNALGDPTKNLMDDLRR